MYPVGDVADGHVFLGRVCEQRLPHLRETVPCNALTLLACRDSFSASTVMQNGSLGSPGRSVPAP